MKLVHLFKYYWPDNGGGIATAMDMAINAFNKYSRGEKNNKQEIVCCWQKPGKKYKEDYYNNIKVYRCKSLFAFASTQFSTQFMRVVNRETKDADIVIYNFPYPFVDLAILFGKIHGKLVIWWHCDFDTTKGKFLTKIYTPLVKHTLKKANAIIVSAKGNIEGSKILNPFKNKCYVIPFAVSDEMVRDGKKYYLMEKALNDKCHILFIGRFVWYKGIDVLLKAYQKLDSNKFELVLAGNGPLFNNMKNLSASLGLNNVTFAGSVSEKEKINLIKWCDYLVLPSISKAEAFAIVQIEAMAYGKPVINTLLPSGVPDVCPNGMAGITVKPKNIDELYKAMKYMGENINFRNKLGKKAIEIVNTNYTMDVLSQRYANLFDSLK